MSPLFSRSMLHAHREHPQFSMTHRGSLIKSGNKGRRWKFCCYGAGERTRSRGRALGMDVEGHRPDFAPPLSVARQQQSMMGFFNKEPDHAAPLISTHPSACCASG